MGHTVLDADIRMASFTCLGSMVSACLHLDEVETLLMTRRKLGNGKKQVLWIVSVCLEQITKSKKLPPGRYLTLKCSLILIEI